MIGFALSSPPGKPKVAFYNEVPTGQGDQLRRPADQPHELRAAALPVDRPDQGQLARRGGREGPQRRCAGGADHSVGDPGGDPEPRHQRRRQPDGRVDPQLAGSDRAPVRRPGDHDAPERGRAGPSPSRCCASPSATCSRSSTAARSSSPARTAAARPAQLAHDRQRDDRLAAAATRRCAPRSTRSSAFADLAIQGLAFASPVLGSIGTPLTVDETAARRQDDADRLLRCRDRGDRLADVRDRAAGGGDARDRALRERLLAAGPRDSSRRTGCSPRR